MHVALGRSAAVTLLSIPMRCARGGGDGSKNEQIFRLHTRRRRRRRRAHVALGSSAAVTLLSIPMRSLTENEP